MGQKQHVDMASDICISSDYLQLSVVSEQCHRPEDALSMLFLTGLNHHKVADSLFFFLAGQLRKISMA